MAVVGGAIALAMTNPEQPEYDTYATQQLTAYLQENVCPDLPSFLGNSLETQCNQAIVDNQSQLRQLITSNTERQDFTVLSHYTTDLRPQDLLPAELQPFLPSGVIPAYRVKTVGAFTRFWIYDAARM